MLYYTNNTFLSTCYSHLNRHLFAAMLSVVIRPLKDVKFIYILKTTKLFSRLPAYSVVCCYKNTSVSKCMNKPTKGVKEIELHGFTHGL